MKKLLSLLLMILILLANTQAQVNRANTKKSVAYRANYQRISSGPVASHNLEIRGGTLWAWGDNLFGQLGDGTTMNRLLPIQIGTDQNWATVATALGHSLGLKTDGTLWAWGNSGYSGADTYVPTLIGTGNNWVSISCGDGQNLALKSDGTLWEWGYLNDAPAPVQVGIENNWAAIATGDSHNLALKSDGSLWAWGSNVEGELGDGTLIDQAAPVQVGQDHDWTSVSGGYTHSVALKSDGTLWTWGGISPSLIPVQTGTGHNWVKTSSGYGSLALKSDGTLWSLGNNSSTQVGTDHNWVSTSANGGHYTGVKADGSLWSWGANGSGQLGNGTTNGEAEPIQVGTLNKWLTINPGYTHTLGLKTNGTLWAWGYNAEGQLGDGTNTQRISPVQIGSDHNWISIAAGTDHSLGLKADGTMWGWGNNSTGQVGDGSTINRNVPVQIGTDNDWVSIGNGSYYSLAIKANGTLWAWGRNDHGQLGNGVSGNYITTPVQVGTDNHWVNASGGFYHTVALKSDGTLWTWGRNDIGQLGNGQTGTGSNFPGQTGSDHDWVRAEAGNLCGHAIKSNGSLWGWGSNGVGQLGDGTTNDRYSPVHIGTDNSWIDVSTSGHAVALKSNGTRWTWGYNGWGELGDGTNVDKFAPAQIGTENTWVSATAGHSHSMAFKSTRDNYCGTGFNLWGQLGDNTTNSRNTFVCTYETGCPPPAAPVTGPAPSVCSGSSATLTATGTGTLGWYDAAGGGFWLGSGSSFITPPISGPITFYVQDSTCAASTTRTAVTVTLKSPLPPPMPYAPNEIICNGESGTLVSYSTFEGVVSWYDAPTGGNYLGSGYVFHTPPLHAINQVTSYYFYLQDSICSASARATAWVQVYPSTVPTFDPIGPVCYGSVPPVLPATSTNYDIPGTWTPPIVSNTESGTYTFHPGGQYLECNVPVSVFIEVIPAPTAGIINISQTTVLTCETNSISLTATGGGSYSWNNGLGNQPSVNINLPGTYTVTVTNANGCSAQASINITGSTTTMPAPVVSGPTNVCNYIGTGQQIMFTVPVASMPTTYTWTVPSTITIISGQGNDTLIVTIGSGFTASANKQIRVQGFSSCAVSGLYIHYLSAQSPGTPAPIAGPADVCSFTGTLTTATYSINPIQAASSYLWTVPVGVQITENNGTNIKVTFSTGFAIGVISVRASNNCGTSSARNITVKSIPPSTPGLISGPTNPCLYKPSLAYPSGLPANYSIVKVANAVSYNWTVPAGATITNHNSTSTEDIITVSFSNSYAYGGISVTALNNCGTSAARSLTLIALFVSSPGLIQGDGDACGHTLPGGTEAHYQVAPVSNANYYNWTVPPGVSGLTGQGTNSISFIYPSNYVSGTVSVYALNACSNSGTRSVIVRKLIPETPHTINITEIQSCPNRIFQYTIPSMPNYAQSILWTIPIGATLLNGQGTLSITVAYPARSFNDKVSATALSDCGSSAIKRLWIVLPACPTPIAGNNVNKQTKLTGPLVSPTASEFSVEFFPNPATTFFNIRVNTRQLEPVMVNVLDMQGRLLNSIKLAPNDVSSIGNELKAGMYIIEIRQGSLLRSIKAVKL